MCNVLDIRRVTHAFSEDMEKYMYSGGNGFLSCLKIRGVVPYVCVLSLISGQLCVSSACGLNGSIKWYL